MVWDAGDVNKLEESDIQPWLEGTYYNLFDANIKAAIKQVKIPYTVVTLGSKFGMYNHTTKNGANGYQCHIFLLSGPEVNFVDNYLNKGEGTALEYFKDCVTNGADPKRVANFNGSAAPCWLRSPNTNSIYFVWYIDTVGNLNSGDCTGSRCIQPALILPSDIYVLDDGTVTTNTAPSTPAGITIPQSISGGTTITISWAAAIDAENNLAGYKVERSTNGGSVWSQIYQGTELKTTNAVAFGTSSVMYRVKAYDDEGLESDWKTSGQVMVVNNVAPGAPATINVPSSVIGGQTITVTWGEATDSDKNLSGYELERKHDSESWGQIYKGPNLSYTDTVAKGWATVQYRVRAYDDLDVTGEYTTSQERTVINNTPPVITCEEHPSSGEDLGEMTDEGITITYSVDDVDQDTVTVTEAIDGVQLKQHQPTLKERSTLDLTGDTWQKVLNGKHTLTITANDGKASTTYTLTFTKKVTAASITLKTPMDADAEITLAILSVTGSIPADAAYKVEATNNAKDGEPVWQDVTQAVKTGTNIVFENREQQNGWAFNFRITVEEGDSGIGGYINSVQGGFQ